MPKPSARKITQAELAKSLGVHQTTISAILAGKSGNRYSAELRERVETAARELGYRPSASARVLRGARSGLIGVFHFGRDKDVESERLHEIVSAIHRSGFSPLAMPMATKVMWLQDDVASASTVMLDAKVEGLVLSGFSDEFDLAQLQRFLDARVPIVSISGIKIPEIPFFGADRARAIHEATSHLIAQGRRKLVYLHRWSSELTNLAGPTSFGAVEGFRRAAEEHGILASDAVPLIKPTPLTSGIGSFQAGEAAFREIWESGLRPNGVVCYDDAWAVGVYAFCQRQGIRIPEEVAITGFENQRICEFLYPRLTSQAQPYQKMATEAITALVSKITQGQEVADTSTLFPCSLIIRESSTQIA